MMSFKNKNNTSISSLPSVASMVLNKNPSSQNSSCQSNKNYSINFSFINSHANSTLGTSESKTGDQVECQLGFGGNVCNLGESHAYTIGLSSGMPFQMNLPDLVLFGQDNTEHKWKMQVSITPDDFPCAVYDSGIESKEGINVCSVVNKASNANAAASRDNSELQKHSRADHSFAKPVPLKVYQAAKKGNQANKTTAVETTILLSDWNIVYTSGHIFLFGKYSNKQIRWRSRPLLTYHRVGARMLTSTLGGRNVGIIGEMNLTSSNKEFTRMPDSIRGLFEEGFPKDWNEILNQWQETINCQSKMHRPTGSEGIGLCADIIPKMGDKDISIDNIKCSSIISQKSECGSLMSNLSLISEHTTRSGSVYSYIHQVSKAVPVMAPMSIANWVPILKNRAGRWKLFIKGDIHNFNQELVSKGNVVGPLKYRTAQGILCIDMQKYVLQGTLENRGPHIPVEIRNKFLETIPSAWSTVVKHWGMFYDSLNSEQQKKFSLHENSTVDSDAPTPLCNKEDPIGETVSTVVSDLTQSVVHTGSQKNTKHVRNMVNWMPQLVKDDNNWGIILKGKLMGPNSRTQFCHRSSTIIHRESLTKVRCRDAIYVLKGPLGTQTQEELDDPNRCIPGGIKKFFSKGVPKNWQKIVAMWVKTCNLHKAKVVDAVAQPGFSAYPPDQKAVTSASKQVKKQNRKKSEHQSEKLSMPTSLGPVRTSSRGRVLQPVRQYWLRETVLQQSYIPPITTNSFDVFHFVGKKDTVSKVSTNLKKNAKGCVTRNKSNKENVETNHTRANKVRPRRGGQISENAKNKRKVVSRKTHTPNVNSVQRKTSGYKRKVMPESQNEEMLSKNTSKRGRYEKQVVSTNAETDQNKEVKKTGKMKGHQQTKASRNANPYSNIKLKQQKLISKVYSNNEMPPTTNSEIITMKSIIALKQQNTQEQCKKLRSEAAAVLSSLAGKTKLSLKQLKQKEAALMKICCLQPEPDPFEDPDNALLLGEEVDDGPVIVVASLSDLPVAQTPRRSLQCTPVANYLGCLAPEEPTKTPATTPTSREPLSLRPRDEVLKYCQQHSTEVQNIPKKVTQLKHKQKSISTNVKKLKQQLTAALEDITNSADSEFSFKDKEVHSDED